MKKYYLLIFVTAFIFISNAQNYQTIEEVNKACTQLSFSGNEDAEIAVDDILDKIGLSRNFVLVECPNINNAVAKNIDDGTGRMERYILYDGNFFTQIDVKAESNWAATSVLAHEIGHHLNGHSLNNVGSNHNFELEADEFSGFVLARMGATLIDAQSAIKTLRYEKATSTHPAKQDRLNAIEKGWTRGEGHSRIIKNNTSKTENPNTAEQVVSNYLQAISVEKSIQSIKTISYKYDGALQGIELALSLKQKYPNKQFFTIDLNENTIQKNVFNGQVGYTEVQGSKTEITGEELKNMKNSNAFFELDLGQTSTFRGLEDYKGIEAHVLNKGLNTYYFDKKSSLKIAEIIGQKGASGDVLYATREYQNYKEVNGILLAHKMIIIQGEMEIIFNLKEALFNQGVTDEDFN